MLYDLRVVTIHAGNVDPETGHRIEEEEWVKYWWISYIFMVYGFLITLNSIVQVWRFAKPPGNMIYVVDKTNKDDTELGKTDEQNRVTDEAI